MEKDDFSKIEELNDCPLAYTLHTIGGKWKLEILYLIYIHNGIRYGQLKRLLINITHKVLANQLKELKNDDMITRIEYPTNPPQVEYSLTSRGKSVLPILKSMYEWGKVNRDD